MQFKAEQQLFNLNTSQEAFDLVRQILESSYDVAVWRLPNEDKIFILIDLTQSYPSGDIEELTRCFIVNKYQDCHPPSPLVLQGDIVITVKKNEKPEVSISPTLSASSMEKFQEELHSSHKLQPGDLSSFESPGEPDVFKGQVIRAIEEIKRGNARKIVLSRFEDHKLPENFDVVALFEELDVIYPNAFCHLTSTLHGTWVGATPERLIAIDENRYFSTDSLAGTQPLMPEDTLSQVAWTQKEIEEQALVSRYIIDCFKRIRLREFDEMGPKTVKAGNLAHLKTEFKVDMEATNSPKLGSTMLELLHPTSAVCGYPRDAVNQFISDVEGYDRELYAGFLGPVGFDGSSRLFVNLRCMKIRGNMARLFSGAGITEDSIPEREYDETKFKLQTLLNVLLK